MGRISPLVACNLVAAVLEGCWGIHNLARPHLTFFGERQDEFADHLIGRWLQVPDQRGESEDAPLVLESGAADGEKLSNSLFFERTRRWKSLLIEPSLKFSKFAIPRLNRTRSTLIRGALSGTGRTYETRLREDAFMSTLDDTGMHGD